MRIPKRVWIDFTHYDPKYKEYDILASFYKRDSDYVEFRMVKKRKKKSSTPESKDE